MLFGTRQAWGERLMWGNNMEWVCGPTLCRALQTRLRCRNLIQEGSLVSFYVLGHWRHDNCSLQFLEQREYAFPIERAATNVLPKGLPFTPKCQQDLRIFQLPYFQIS